MQPKIAAGTKLWGTVSLGHSVLGQDVSGAERHKDNIPWAERRGAGGQHSAGLKVLGQEVGNQYLSLLRNVGVVLKVKKLKEIATSKNYLILDIKF